MIYGECRKKGIKTHQCSFCKYRIYGCEEYEKLMKALGKSLIKIKNKNLPGGFYYKLLKKEV